MLSNRRPYIGNLTKNKKTVAYFKVIRRCDVLCNQSNGCWEFVYLGIECALINIPHESSRQIVLFKNKKKNKYAFGWLMLYD